MVRSDIAIITAYNDVLSALPAVRTLPAKRLEAGAEGGGPPWARWAGGVPAMCDGVTQGQDGMELSLMSRDVIAMSAAVGPSHQYVRRRAVPRHLRQDRAGGLVMAALSFDPCPRCSCRPAR